MTRGAKLRAAQWLFASGCMLTSAGARAASPDNFELALGLLTPVATAECASRLPAKGPALTKSYAAWLEKLPSSLKNLYAEQAEQMKSAPPDSDLKRFADRFRALPPNEFAKHCQTLQDWFDAQPEVADPQRQEPCATWRHFAEAMGRQDLRTARAMVSGTAAQALNSLAQDAKPEHFANWSANLENCSPGARYGNFQEVFVTTRKNNAYIVTLSWTGKNWVIVSM
jgi:hypothetical protein